MKSICRVHVSRSGAAVLGGPGAPTSGAVTVRSSPAAGGSVPSAGTGTGGGRGGGGGGGGGGGRGAALRPRLTQALSKESEQQTLHVSPMQSFAKGGGRKKFQFQPCGWASFCTQRRALCPRC